MERDLSSHDPGRFRILGAESGGSALEAARWRKTVMGAPPTEPAK
jgi:hypothetical protein